MRPSGLPKTGGRKKGTPNKKSYLLDYHLEENDFDLVKELLTLYPTLENQQKVNLLLKLLEFSYPKRKPTCYEPMEGWEWL